MLKRIFTPADKRYFRILQWNCNGVRPKLSKLQKYLQENNIDAAFIQETHLNKKHMLEVGSDYIIQRCDRPSHKGGVMSIFHKNVCFYRMRIRPPPGVEGQSWNLYLHNGEVLTVHNWYNPIQNNKMFSLGPVQGFMRSGSLLLGDFNCKSLWWGYSGRDRVGKCFEQFVHGNDVKFLNKSHEKTFVGKSCKGTSRFSLESAGTSPDLSLASVDIADDCDWLIGDNLGSDHKTIKILIDMSGQGAVKKGRVEPIQARKKKRKLSFKVRLKRKLKLCFKNIKQFLLRKIRK